MTTEFVLLLSLVVFILFGYLFGENGPQATFAESAPRLAARIERNLETGGGWTTANGESTEWVIPVGEAPEN